VVSHDRYPAHAEPSLALNPRDPRNLLGASQVISPGLHSVETFASFDGGRTWRDNGPLPLPPGTNWADDVTVAFDGRGAGFVAAMATSHTAQGLSQTERGVYVWRTDDGGRTFHAPAAVVSRQFTDHPWLAADTSPGAQDLYVAWTAADGLAFSRSVDGGRHFDPGRIIGVPSSRAEAPMLVTGPTGTVVVVYGQGVGGADAPDADMSDSAGTMSSKPRAANGEIDTSIAVVASTDHGQHFGQPVVLGSGAYALVPGPDLSAPTGPSAAVDPHGGAIYVAYAAPALGRRAGGNSILLARSRTGGQTWEAPVRVANTGTAVYFQPQVAVDDAGLVDVTFFSLVRGRVELLLDRASGPRLRFGPAVPVTPTSFDPALSQAGSGGKHGAWWIGDYQGLAVGGGQIHPFWNDTRGGRLDILTTTIPDVGAH
jgi:hypothetical protein